MPVAANMTLSVTGVKLLSTALAANPHIAARRAVVAAVLADQRGIGAFGTLGAGDDRGAFFGRGAFEDAHLLLRRAILVEDAEHRVPVQDQPREVGDGRREVLLLLAAGDEGHEVAQRLREVEQLLQLHSHPGWVEYAHVERQ